jgi:acyl carrier protein
MTDDLVSLIIATLKEVDGRQERSLPDSLNSGTRLFGRDGALDSLGLVTLIVAVEQALEDQYGVSVSLADEKAMSQKHSPYRTIGSLAEYASRLINGGSRDG